MIGYYQHIKPNTYFNLDEMLDTFKNTVTNYPCNNLKLKLITCVQAESKFARSRIVAKWKKLI